MLLSEVILSSSRIATADGAAAPPETFPRTFMSARFAIFPTVTAELAIVTAPVFVIVTSPLSAAAVNPVPSPIKI